MNFWKITNLHNDAVKIVISTSSSGSKGLKLQPNQFVVCAPKQTPTMDAQIRRKFISVEKGFDNDTYGFTSGVPYDNSALEAKKLEIAETKAMQYVNNKPSE